jgi:hypothetical protein
VHRCGAFHTVYEFSVSFRVCSAVSLSPVLVIGGKASGYKRHAARAMLPGVVARACDSGRLQEVKELVSGQGLRVLGVEFLFIIIV